MTQPGFIQMRCAISREIAITLIPRSSTLPLVAATQTPKVAAK